MLTVKNTVLDVAQDAADRIVIGCDARLAVDDEDDRIGLFGAHERLFANGALEDVVVAHLDTAGIDEREMNAAPFGLVIRAVARDAAHLMHDGVVAVRDAVHERRFADIGAPYDGDDWQCHDHNPLTSSSI